MIDNIIIWLPWWLIFAAVGLIPILSWREGGPSTGSWPKISNWVLKHGTKTIKILSGLICLEIIMMIALSDSLAYLGALFFTITLLYTLYIQSIRWSLKKMGYAPSPEDIPQRREERTPLQMLLIAGAISSPIVFFVLLYSVMGGIIKLSGMTATIFIFVVAVACFMNFIFNVWLFLRSKGVKILSYPPHPQRKQL